MCMSTWVESRVTVSRLNCAEISAASFGDRLDAANLRPDLTDEIHFLNVDPDILSIAPLEPLSDVRFVRSMWAGRAGSR